MVLFAVYLFSIRVYDEGDARVEQGTFTPLLAEGITEPIFTLGVNGEQLLLTTGSAEAVLNAPAAASATPGRRGKINVNGPGQKACIKARAKSGTSDAKSNTCEVSPTCTIKG